MTSPEDSPVFTAGTVYTQSSPSIGFWGKLANGIGNVASGIAHYAGEALPYIAQAASAYADAMNTGNSSLDTMGSYLPNLTYQSKPTDLPTFTPIPIQTISITTPKPIGQMAAAKVQVLQKAVEQQTSGVNPTRTQRINILNALTQNQTQPTYGQHNSVNGQISAIHPTEPRLLPSQVQDSQNTSQRPFIQEQPYSIQGA